MNVRAKAVGISFDHSKYPILYKTFRFPVPLPEGSWPRARIDAIFQDKKIRVEEVAKVGIDNEEARPGVTR
jgi:hypothetical protein